MKPYNAVFTTTALPCTGRAGGMNQHEQPPGQTGPNDADPAVNARRVNLLAHQTDGAICTVVHADGHHRQQDGSGKRRNQRLA